MEGTVEPGSNKFYGYCIMLIIEIGGLALNSLYGV